jgi:hypothetical protein
MNKRFISLFAVTILLGATLALPSRSFAQAVTDSNIAEKISSAKTPADHEAIAGYYSAQANAEKAKVDTHAKMIAAYQGLGKSGTGMVTHCTNIANKEKATAADYEAMAAAHRDMAKSAK